MKYILVQFQRDKGKEFAGKYYIYKYDENKIKDSFVSGDVINELINSSGYPYSNAAVVTKVFDNYKEYVELQKFNDESAFNDSEINELTHISLFKRMFRVGDKVRIHKPKDINEWPTWTSNMDAFDNKIGTVTAVSPFNSNEYYCYIDYEPIGFNTNWLERIENYTIDFELGWSDKIYSDSDTKKYQNPLSFGDYAASAFKEVLSICQEQDNKNKESEGNNMDFSKMLNVEFGKIAGTAEVAACLYGVAIRGSDGRYRAYDKSNSKIVDVTGMTFDTDMLFKVPCAISQIGVGDVIINAGNYVTVTNIHKDGTFTVVDPKASEQKIAIPAKNMFGFDFMTKIFYPLDNFFKPTGDNPFGLNPMAMMLLASGDNMDMSTLALMTMMGNGITDQSMMLPMILMLNQDKTSNSDSMNQGKTNKSDFMNSFALMMMMGNMGKTNETKIPSAKEKELEEEIEKYRELEKKMKKVLDTEPVPEGIEPYAD